MIHDTMCIRVTVLFGQINYMWSISRLPSPKCVYINRERELNKSKKATRNYYTQLKAFEPRTNRGGEKSDRNANKLHMHIRQCLFKKKYTKQGCRAATILQTNSIFTYPLLTFFCAKLFEFILSGFFQDYFLEDSLLYALSRIDEHFFWFRYNFALLST